MVELRKKLSKYNDYLYGIMLLLFGVMASGGFISADLTYKVVFALCGLLWLAKMVLSDYTIKQLLVIGIIFALLGYTFLANREKSCIISAMAITGAQGVNLRKVFKWSLFAKCIISIELMVLSYFHIIRNIIVENTKGSDFVATGCLGYGHPNQAFLNILLIGFLMVLAYGETLKWYVYLVFTGIIFWAYKIFYCRTGMIVWICFLLALCLYYISNIIRLKNCFLAILCSAPVAITIITFLLSYMYNSGNYLAIKMDKLLHGRVVKVASYPLGIKNILACKANVYFDNGLYHFMYNYGIVFFAIVLVTYVVLLIKLYKANYGVEIIALACSVLVIYMESFPGLSVGFNYSLVLFSIVLYGNVNVLGSRQDVREDNK